MKMISKPMGIVVIVNWVQLPCVGHMASGSFEMTVKRRLLGKSKCQRRRSEIVHQKQNERLAALYAGQAYRQCLAKMSDFAAFRERQNLGMGRMRIQGKKIVVRHDLQR
jgi:hypothetical protein